jgi:hypothetical protein
MSIPAQVLKELHDMLVGGAIKLGRESYGKKRKITPYQQFFKDNHAKVRERLSAKYKGAELNKMVFRGISELWKGLAKKIETPSVEVKKVETIESETPKKSLSGLTKKDLTSKDLEKVETIESETPKKSLSGLTKKDLTSKDLEKVETIESETPKKSLSGLTKKDLTSKDLEKVETIESETPKKSLLGLTKKDLTSAEVKKVETIESETPKESLKLLEKPTNVKKIIEKFEEIAKPDKKQKGKKVKKMTDEEFTKHLDELEKNKEEREKMTPEQLEESSEKLDKILDKLEKKEERKEKKEKEYQESLEKGRQLVALIDKELDKKKEIPSIPQPKSKEEYIAEFNKLRGKVGESSSSKVGESPSKSLQEVKEIKSEEPKKQLTSLKKTPEKKNYGDLLPPDVIPNKLTKKAEKQLELQRERQDILNEAVFGDTRREIEIKLNKKRLLATDKLVGEFYKWWDDFYKRGLENARKEFRKN